MLIRAASSTSSQKPIVLEQPDKFRPPSHASRLTSRRGRAPAAYNQGTTAEEQETQKTRTYPHMFPEKGSFMHWFLTDRWIHIWITMGTLTLLAVITLSQTFLKTSPYAHLIPPISSLPFHPITYIRESLSVIKLHIDYTTAQANESRQQKILDAQKRRLYRRAHGMEDLNAAEEQGIDVRGLVPWDDGLTNAERERGGREEVMTGLKVVEMGGQVGDDVNEFARRLKEKREKGEEGGEEIEQVQREPPKKRKLWLGIW
ncbi:hypothetical protein LTR47_008725 [Exophiala xenobiotica]|nr:hypothetical protein LTR41_007179 [Exophiala xenobiotica]KAK5227447.1 hypothetical protein LTR47_008725 [Exophiala xenobiotica]KAK5251854.1 hypothetical protein LTS06_003589 [Exophiala xenobiotica]KAK5261702.1 hypothetical protein LTR40_001764 [Exophiala xenobiotica]KAK5314611.1 hypothetical protein LTR93_010335 [Exophiala xenobiotica]